MTQRVSEGQPTEQGAIEDVADTTVQAVALAAKSVVEGLATGIVKVGEATPTATPLFAALKFAKEVLDGVKRHRERLEELYDRCTIVTTYVIIGFNSASSEIDLALLAACVEAVGELAARCSIGGVFAKVERYQESDRIKRLRRQIEALVPTMGLGGVAKVSEQVEGARRDVEAIADVLKTPSTDNKAISNCDVHAQVHNARDVEILSSSTPRSPSKLSPAPTGIPKAKGWHVVRNAMVDDVHNHFVAAGSPRMAGLVGCSGSGKTTTAAMVVGDGIGVVPSLHGEETRELALERLSRVRALFPDGVVWLRVGRDAVERLPGLMQDLAKMVYEVVLHSRGHAPGQSPTDPMNGAAYVQEALATESKGRSLRCLLVADDVWEPEVVEGLRKTSMRVLLTTRDRALVDNAGGKVVIVEQLRQEEAEALVTTAAELREGAGLRAPVYELLELCDNVAMYVESVARRMLLSGRNDGGSWSKAVDKIRRHLLEVEEENQSVDGDGSVSADLSSFARKRFAILGAELECLRADDSQSGWLYVALSVMPSGHAFEVHEAAVLLFGHAHTEHDLEQAGRVVETLERWAIITVAGRGLYCMHEARLAFVRMSMVDVREDIRREAVERWQMYLSTLEVVRSVEVYDLLGLWQAVGCVGEERLRELHPYDSALSALDTSDPLLILSAEAVADLYSENGDFHGAEAVMRKVWERCESHPEANLQVSLTALLHCRQGPRCQDEEEDQRLLHLMIPLVDSAKERWALDGRTAASATDGDFLHLLGSCSHDSKRMGEAEAWYRRALEAQDKVNLDTDRVQAPSIRSGLAMCLVASGRCSEAELLFRESLDITKARRGTSSISVANVLGELAGCLVELDRHTEAESLYRQELVIKEARLGVEHEDVAYTLYELANCLVNLNRNVDAASLFRRALAIEEARLGVQHAHVASTLYGLGECLVKPDRNGEAESVFRRALAIEEARLGLEHVDVASTLHALAMCLLRRHRAGEAEPFFRRVLAIDEARLGTEHSEVADTLVELARCLRRLDREGEAEPLLRRALVIKEARLGAEDLEVAGTVYNLAKCLVKLNRDGEASSLFRRALAIEEHHSLRKALATKEASLGVEHVEVAYTLHELAICLVRLERTAEAEPLFRRALVIKEARLGVEHVAVAYTLVELASCLENSAREREAEPLFRRALAIEEVRLGMEDLQVALTLYMLGRCLLSLNREKEAESLFRRVRAITEARLGTEDVRVAYTLYMLGICLLRLDQPEEAESLLRKALAIKEARLGLEDLGVARTQYNLAKCLVKLDRAGVAESLFRRVLAIEEARLGMEHVEVAHTLVELARCLRRLDREGEAETLFRRALAIKEARLGTEDPEVAHSLNTLARCLVRLDRHGEAASLFRRALAIKEARLGVENVQVTHTLH